MKTRIITACALFATATAVAAANEIKIDVLKSSVNSEWVDLLFKIENSSGRYIEAAYFKCLVFDAQGSIVAIDTDHAEKLESGQVDYVKSSAKIENAPNGPLGRIDCRVLDIE